MGSKKQWDELGSHCGHSHLDQGDSSAVLRLVGLDSACILKAKPAARAEDLAGGHGGDG